MQKFIISKFLSDIILHHLKNLTNTLSLSLSSLPHFTAYLGIRRSPLNFSLYHKKLSNTTLNAFEAFYGLDMLAVTILMCRSSTFFFLFLLQY